MTRPVPIKSLASRAALALGCALGAVGAHALEPDVLFSKVSGSVWGVRAFDAQARPLRDGTAVVVAPGRLVTACHVLAKASSFVVRRDNVSYGGTLEFPDPARDLCQIRVANFNAPPVQLAPTGAARVGQRIYAIGNPRGSENTLSVGIVSGLGSAEGAEPRLLQTTIAIAAGASGGGLFDSDGRLLALMNGAVREFGGGNSAIPIEYVAELPERARIALAVFEREPAPPMVASGRSGLALAQPLRPGDALEYVRTDKLTGKRATVTYRLDRTSGDELSFNAGGRVEKIDGHVVSILSPVGGLYDASSPPGGWARKDLRPGMRWHLEYVASQFDNLRHEVDATVVGESSIQVDGTDLKVYQIAYEGWIYASYAGGPALTPRASRLTAQVFYSPDVGRVVRFEAQNTRPPFSATNEVLEMIRIAR